MSAITHKFGSFLLLGLVLVALIGCGRKSQNPSTSAREDEYIRLMNTGKNYLDQDQHARALEVYLKAVKLAPTDPDVHLNLANAYLRGDQPESALREAEEVLRLDSNSAAAWFIKGAAHLRLGQQVEAAKALQTARELEPMEPAVDYQLGLAHFQLKQWDEAIAAFTRVVDADPEHPSAHYQLSQALLRSGRNDEAQAALETHQQIAAQNAGQTLTPADLEKSKFTEARVPFRLEQPSRPGISLRFVADTSAAFGTNAANYHGPIAILDPNHTGWNSLFVLERTGEGAEGGPGLQFRLLWNNRGVFKPAEEAYPASRSNYHKMLVGDLNNDRYEDVIVLGSSGSHVFKFATNGMAMDVSPFTRLQSLEAIDGALADLDFTGKLDLVVVTAGTNDLRLYRQFGPLLFTDITKTSGIPAELNTATMVLADDWPKDEMLDLVVARKEGPPLLLVKERGGSLVPTNVPSWSSGSVLATGDLNNDLRIDLVIASGDQLHVIFNGTQEKREIPLEGAKVNKIYLQDFDNDGWLDIWACGDRLSAWRNLGQSGFENQSKTLGLDLEQARGLTELHFADFDLDGDSDLVASRETGGLLYLRNDGGNTNHQLKVRLLGNRSNASGLGVQVEVTTGGLRLSRTVQQLPVEIGVGKNSKLETFTVHWFNLALPAIDVEVERTNQIVAVEITLPDGSCPYLYAWDGTKFRFITDLLGAAPAGLPVAEGRYIEADPEEYAWVGDESTFVPRDGYYVLQVTEELREALYLDEAKLVVVDHPPGTEVHSLDKLVPGRPFPPSGFISLSHETPLRQAVTLSGREVTSLLARVDHQRVSPERLRIPQQRGLAEPHGVILDFGEVDVSRPLALVLNGWLRFGGGMANINASQDPDLPFPFPVLEAEVDGTWRKVDVVVGAPAGKTKSIVVQLAGKLPPATRRLKLSTAFEIHWDRIALMEEVSSGNTRIAHTPASSAHLHWRGFSEFEDLSWDWPLTPNYEVVVPDPKWRITPSGWCTRYGEVSELIAQRDEGLLIMNGGDELTLKFSTESLPKKPEGFQRQYFIYSDGWDKDSDFHVAAGTTVEPLPWHGMDDQLYGRQERPKFESDSLHEKYNTRWVGPQTLKRVAAGK